MQDEVDTTTRWACPRCGKVLEVEYAQMQVEIMLHERKCPAKNVKIVNNDKERR